ncbi:MAG: carbohydrate ABC transporter permease [Casimicrobiaceae bacterium]
MAANTLQSPAVAGGVRADWAALARSARIKRVAGQSALLTFLLIVSVPIILPYFWMVVISFTARTGGVSTQVLWTACAVIVPAVLIYSVVHMMSPSSRVRAIAIVLLLVAVGALLAALVGGQLHLANYRFLWNPNIIEDIRSKATSGGQFPSVWSAFFNSLLLAAAQTAIILVVASLSGYYISRFAFRGREAFLQSLLVLHAFPAMTLIIPIFLLLHWVGLLDTMVGVILVLTTIELPFYVFVMKGFFDAVPWDIEMSAMTDGASRRQAFRLVVLPQVRVGLIAIAVFAFIRAWEEYIFVRTLLIENKNWVMSLYLFWVSDDIMGVDYGIVAAVSVFYVLPSLLLYVFCQKYLTQMSIGGIRG